MKGKHKQAGFKARQVRRGAAYSPHYGERGKRGPCRTKGHAWQVVEWTAARRRVWVPWGKYRVPQMVQVKPKPVRSRCARCGYTLSGSSAVLRNPFGMAA